MTDLTNTTWILNNDLSSATYIGIVYIDFTSNNTTFNRIDTDEIESDGLLVYGATNTRITVYNSFNNGWVEQAYRTIEITGGTDATNSTLISWLEANATQQVEPTSSTTNKIGDLPIIKKHFGDLEIIKEVLNGSVIYEKAPSYEYSVDNGILTITNAVYTLENGILTIGE